MGNEWRLLARHPLFWIVLAGTAAFSLLVAKGSPAQPGSSAIEALLRLNLFIPTFLLPFAAGALGPIFYLREVEYDMADMVGTYPITLKDWLLMRGGNFFLLLCFISLVAQAMFLSVLGPLHADALTEMATQTLAWLVVLHMPACLLWASVLAWLACRKASSGFLYLAAGLGWIAYLGVATLTGTPLIAGSETVWPMLKQAMLVIDPYAATALVNPMPETGVLQSRWFNIGVGRLFWMGFAIFALASISHMPTLVERRLIRISSAPSRTLDLNSDNVKIGHVLLHLRYFTRDRIFWPIVLGWFALFLPEAYGGMGYAEPLSIVAADSRDALNRVVWDVFPLAGAMAMLYAADRVCRLYPASGMHELYAATPHSSWRLTATQAASLSILAAFFTFLTGFAVLTAQFLLRSPIQPSEYLVQLGPALGRLMLFGAAFAAVHGLVRPRFIANLICLALLALGLSNLAPAMGLHHPLWKPFNTPLEAPDHLWGYAGGLGGYATYMLVWLPAVFALLILAILSANRTLASAQVRLNSILLSPAIIVAALGFCFAAWQGAEIDGRLRAEGALISPDERAQARADYERIYAGWERVAQPDIESIRTKIDFYPAENRAGLRARLILVNRTDQPIAKILVGKGPMAGAGNVTVNRAAKKHRDSRLGQTVFELESLMRPGESMELGFELDISRSTLQPSTFPLMLRKGFSSLPVHAALPVIGFKRELTLRDPVTRKELGLPALRRALPSKIVAPPSGSLSGATAMIDAIVSTDQGSYAIAQGALLRRWSERGRAVFHYRTREPIRNMSSAFSVPWQPQIFAAGPYKLHVYTPDQLRADNPNVLAARDTLASLEKHIAPYPGDMLHLLAAPDAGPTGFAYPQIIQISHRLGFRAKPQPDAGFDQRYRRAVHETAHQWFGHLLGYGLIDERAFLIESLAKYAELVMIEQRYGRRAMRALVEFERDRYRHARLDPEQSTAFLINAEESEDMYSRATLAFACLRNQLGDAAIFGALKRMADDSRLNQRAATSMSFMDALKRSSSPRHAKVIDQLFLSSDPIQLVEMRFGCVVAR
ncbi:MAG: hypothetical protein ACK4SJ_02185 [Sphingorhabdus sp.]